MLYLADESGKTLENYNYDIYGKQIAKEELTINDKESIMTVELRFIDVLPNESLVTTESIDVEILIHFPSILTTYKWILDFKESGGQCCQVKKPT